MLNLRTILSRFILCTLLYAVCSNVVYGQVWGEQYPEYHGAPWVRNMSRPYSIDNGLEGRHISLWASHGIYYNLSEERWKWQRPLLMGTHEDLFTQTIVVPYLIPMLERAGAVVFTPRERDWQDNEVIVDNDNDGSGYNEEHGSWKRAKGNGFKQHWENYTDGENPFEAGTARQVKAKKKGGASVSWQPSITEAGRYAVYVSYKTLEKSIPDAHYIVFHKGQRTDVQVNQQMGGGTWVYIGTYEFDEGSSLNNRVVLTNESGMRKGIVTADAVRFGGGMGNISRHGKVSGQPRCDEGARYYAQWAGMPYNVYSGRKGKDDYSDDINVRSLMTNYMSGGSIFNPAEEGLGVPLELSLALHSDAGKSSSIVGSLAICTTDFNDKRLGSGYTRYASKDFARMLLENADKDMRKRFGRWNKRYLWDRSYSETRLPQVPAAILEMLSHENLEDMRYGHDPEFKFYMARSIYKTILRYLGGLHGQNIAVQPLTPELFRVEFKDGNTLRLLWSAREDETEPTAKPTAYVLYTAKGNEDFNNGQVIRGTACALALEPGTLYRFKVSAINSGGESFPTEELAAQYTPDAHNTIMIVNGFHRLSAPMVKGSGFDLNADAGVTLGRTAGWDIMPFVAGNDKNYVSAHARAIASAGKYNIVSSQSQAIEAGLVQLDRYGVIDMVLGLEKNTYGSLRSYKSLSGAMRQKLQAYSHSGGNLLVSGSYIGSDLSNSNEQQWLRDVLKVRYDGSAELNDTINGMQTTITYWKELNAKHYAAQHAEILNATDSTAFTVLTDNEMHSAAVAYKGEDYHSMTLGFPIECIQDDSKRDGIMRAIMSFLLRRDE